jgi:hypothetical protein
MAQKNDDQAAATSAADETGVLAAKPDAGAAKQGDHDRIVMASRAPDGTPAQINPEFIGDKETVKEAAEKQLAEQAVSAVDVAARGVASGDTGGAGSSEPDAAVAELKAAQEKAADQARSRADAEVNKLHKGLGE